MAKKAGARSAGPSHRHLTRGFPYLASIEHGHEGGGRRHQHLGGRNERRLYGYGRTKKSLTREGVPAI